MEKRALILDGHSLSADTLKREIGIDIRREKGCIGTSLLAPLKPD